MPEIEFSSLTNKSDKSEADADLRLLHRKRLASFNLKPNAAIKSALGALRARFPDVMHSSSSPWEKLLPGHLGTWVRGRDRPPCSWPDRTQRQGGESQLRRRRQWSLAVRRHQARPAARRDPRPPRRRRDRMAAVAGVSRALGFADDAVLSRPALIGDRRPTTAPASSPGLTSSAWPCAWPRSPAGSSSRSTTSRKPATPSRTSRSRAWPRATRSRAASGPMSRRSSSPGRRKSRCRRRGICCLYEPARVAAPALQASTEHRLRRWPDTTPVGRIGASEAGASRLAPPWARTARTALCDVLEGWLVSAEPRRAKYGEADLSRSHFFVISMLWNLHCCS